MYRELWNQIAMAELNVCFPGVFWKKKLVFAGWCREAVAGVGPDTVYSAGRLRQVQRLVSVSWQLTVLDDSSCVWKAMSSLPPASFACSSLRVLLLLLKHGHPNILGAIHTIHSSLLMEWHWIFTSPAHMAGLYLTLSVFQVVET